MQARQRQPGLRADGDDLLAFWRAIVRPGDVHEVRVPKTRKGPRRWFGVASGYFDDADAFVGALEHASGHDAEGVYLTLNPVNPALLARAANRLRDGRPVTTQDADVLRRRHLLVDVDPVRPAGISATDGEMAAALVARDRIAEGLGELGWPPPVARMATGNGGALVYRLALDNDPAALALVEGALRGLAAAFDSPAARVDTGTANAARIFKVAGTVAAKGDDVPDRPWRVASAAYGASPVPVTPALLEAAAAWAPEPEPGRRAGDGRFGAGPRDVRGALAGAGVGFREKAKAWGTVLELDRCLTSGDHADGACVIEFASGALAYRCLHNRCAGKRWEDVRAGLGFGGGDPGPRVTIGGVDHATGEVLGDEDGGRPAGEQAPPDGEPAAHAIEYPVPCGAAFFGWFGEYLGLMEPTTEAPDAFHLGVALTLVGAMIGRRVALDYASSHLHANLYTVLVGASGYSRKDTAILRGLRVPDLQMAAAAGGAALPREFQVVYNVSSAEGLITDLSRNPNTLLYISEFSSLVRNARRKATNTILPALITAYNGMPLQNNVKKESERGSVEAPCLSLIAATQPDVLAADMTGEDIASGFANRALWFPGQGKESRPRPPALDKQRAWALYERLWHHLARAYPVGTVLALHEDTRDLWDAWYTADRARMGRDPDEDSMRVRHAEFIHKVALQFAVVDGAREVRARHMEPAMRLMEWQWDAVRLLMREWGKGTFSIIEGRIRAVLLKYGAMKRWQVQARCKDRRWSSVEFSQVFKSMKENRVVVEAGDGTVALAPGVRS